MNIDEINQPKTKFDPRKQYFVRIAPIVGSINNYSIRSVGLIRKDDGWHEVDGKVAEILSNVATNGYTFAECAQMGRFRVRGAFDVARDRQELADIEAWYQREEERRVPGTAERPNRMRRLSMSNPHTAGVVSELVAQVREDNAVIEESEAQGSVALTTGEPEAPSMLGKPGLKRPKGKGRPAADAS